MAVKKVTKPKVEKKTVTKEENVVTKSQLIEILAKDLKKPKQEVEKFLSTFKATLKDLLSKKKHIKCVGFMHFKVKVTSAREIRSPATGKPIKLKPKYRVVIKPGSDIRNAVAS